MKKPPDPGMNKKYKTFNIPLKKIIKNVDEIDNKLEDAVKRTNKIVIHTYQFVRLWIISKHNDNKVIPKITEDTFKLAFRALSKKPKGNKPKGDNLKLYIEFVEFYDKVYSKLGYVDKVDTTNLSQVLNYTATDMKTNYDNNIKMHFTNHLKRFVNTCFREKHNKILEDYKGKDKIAKRKELNKLLGILKNDLLENKTESKNEYSTWLNNYRSKLLPNNYEKSYHYDVHVNPHKYINHMIFMISELEKLEKKIFQIFPLRTSIYPKYIQIDTTTLVDLTISKDKSNDGKAKREYFSNIEKCKELFWNKYFNLNHQIFKKKNYVFDNRIVTDGYTVSVALIHKYYEQVERNKKLNMKKAKDELKKNTKNMTEEQIKKYKKDREEQKKKDKQRLKNPEKKKKKTTLQELMKGMTKEQKVKFRKEYREKKEKEKLDKEEQDKLDREKSTEFPYYDELSEETLHHIRYKNKIFCDPGKRDLIYMIDDKGNKFHYSNKQYVSEIKRLKYQRLNQNYKDKNDISVIENQLSSYNSKTCSLEKFKNYVKKKNEINEKLFKLYEEKRFRQYKFYSYINKNRALDNLNNKLIEIYGEDSMIMYGDYGVYQLRNFISTPGIGLKRKIGEKFTIYSLDEFRTSCLDNKTHNQCENIYLPDKKNKLRKIHSVLMYQTENKRLGCVNRDYNSVRNMKYIVDYWFEYRKRPEKFCRSYKFDNK